MGNQNEKNVLFFTLSDVVATILDYLGGSQFDQSDGTSLRHFIEDISYNKDYDEETIICERDARYPTNESELFPKFGYEPNLMIRKGSYKLIMTKKSNSTLLDMMYDLEEDPYEETNLIASDANLPIELVGKAEHLKALLLDWMKRNDGAGKFYSDNRYNNGEGQGDITEISNRQTWPTTAYWQSDPTLSFGKPVWLSDELYVRNEYMYIGRTSPGELNITSILLTGEGSEHFSIFYSDETIQAGKYARIKVHFESWTIISFANFQLEMTIEYRSLDQNNNGEDKVRELNSTVPVIFVFETREQQTANPIEPKPTRTPTGPTGNLDGALTSSSGSVRSALYYYIILFILF